MLTNSSHSCYKLIARIRRCFFHTNTAKKKIMSYPIVEIEQGKLQGDTGVDLSGQPFLRFRGIPYAKPPLGEQRFKIAEPAEPWSGVRDATNDGDRCIQNDFLTRKVTGSEDCLNLSVYTKELPSSETPLKPVMVYIHGGGFTGGSNNYNEMANPEFLMIEDVVLVAINYRVGLIGFLSIRNPSVNIPGNNGLKDQVMALRWVQHNISKFNGDPENVTIFGHSAGGASVEFQVLSPMSKGLFHKAMIQSGGALNSWAWGTRGNAIAVAEVMGHKVSNEKEAVKILKQTPVEALLEAQAKIPDGLIPSFRRLFSPVVEEPNDSAFLSQEPQELLVNGDYNKVPLIIGFANREGNIIDFLKLAGFVLKGTIDEAIPVQMKITPNSKDHETIINKIKNIYNGPDKEDNDYTLFSDSIFVASMIQSLKMYVRNGNSSIYLYVFTLKTDPSLIQHKIFSTQNLKGVGHAGDMGYLFKTVFGPEVKPGSFEEIAVKRYVKLVTNFARNGNPTPSDELGVTWKPVQSETNIDYLNIGEELVMEVNPDSERMQLWQELFENHPMVFKN